jgi:hypothetical protein
MIQNESNHRFEPRSDQTKDYKIGICYFSAKHAVILWVAFLDPSDSYFLFADLVGFIHIEHICSFFVAFFSATLEGRNLIFGHKLHIGATKYILDGRKDGRKEGRTDGQTDRGKTVYPPPPSGSGCITKIGWLGIGIMLPSGATFFIVLAH